MTDERKRVWEPAPFGKASEDLTNALKRQSILQIKIRETLSGTPTIPPSEKSNVPEKTRRTFQKVIFGHPITGFDRDQLLTYYLALQVGVINSDTPIEFSAEPSQEQFEDPTIMVIESSVLPLEQKNAVKLGNYLTGANDEPAAVIFANHFSREIKALENGEALQELVLWLRSVDTGTPLTKPLVHFTQDVLRSITPIFYALKLHQADPDQLIAAMTQMLDTAVAHPKDSQTITAHYQPQLTELKQKRQEDFAKLESRARQPESLKTTTTLTGITLAYFDIRGLDIESGGLTVAKRITQADVVFLIDSITDPADPKKTLGTQLIINSDTPNYVNQSIAERLQMSEMLFGKGFTVNRMYGGHPGIISSPAWLGSDLKPENVWVALQKHYNSPRYSKAEFIQQGKQLAEKLGIDKGIPQLFVPPSDEYSLAEWHMQLTIPDEENNQKIITISESDLPLYEILLTANSAKNRHLFLQKTIVSEPNEIVELRQTRAEVALPDLIKNKEATQILLLLDDLNKNSIESLSFEQQLALLEAISLDQMAIDQVWNKNNLLFRITHAIPEWIASDLETYKAERFKYTSVPKKVDGYLLDAIIEKITKNISESELIKVITILSRIIFSDAYKTSHHQKSYDTLLEKYLQVLVHADFPKQIALETIKKIETEYGSDMESHWHTISPALIHQLKETFPDHLRFLDSWDTHTEVKSNTVDFMVVKEPDLEKPHDTSVPLTIFVEIGRPIEQDLRQKGIHTRNQAAAGGHQTLAEFASEIRVPGRTLNVDKKHEEHLVVANEIVRHLVAVHTAFPESKIRIVAGSFPNILTRKLVTQIPRHMWSQVFFCEYNSGTGQFYDDEPLAPSQENEFSQ